jgi:hypothetical protein
MLLLYGLRKPISVRDSCFFQVGRKNPLISLRDNMPELRIVGFILSVWILRTMEHTRCDVQRLLLGSLARNRFGLTHMALGLWQQEPALPCSDFTEVVLIFNILDRGICSDETIAQ